MDQLEKPHFSRFSRTTVSCRLPSYQLSTITVLTVFVPCIFNATSPLSEQEIEHSDNSIRPPKRNDARPSGRTSCRQCMTWQGKRPHHLILALRLIDRGGSDMTNTANARRRMRKAVTEYRGFETGFHEGAGATKLL
nr:hypothetical protein CFP56_66997 [Quercus suber]